MTINLSFGFQGVPESVTTAWGARWIITQDGDIDQVWDRTDSCGPDDKRRELLDHLTDKVGGAPRLSLSALLRSRKLSTRDDTVVVLYEDEKVVVVGSPQSSGGYFYVTAYWAGDVDHFRYPAKTFDEHGEHIDVGPWLKVVHEANAIQPEFFGRPTHNAGGIEEYPDARIVHHNDVVSIIPKTDLGFSVITAAALMVQEAG